ncbi:DUF2059 domain-containing protein [Schlegelella sp. S2-27]|uniref:DUF2059 domain-containing protein n=1 Tax=Caldimonas mangrovi TaxID=2944811 RepID=A0ABT0YH39_9BURK|nr:DUF2059 domain-containing protein [Caldimonas mangrovi]MCM5678056.1 DUF2059 domain-containing protein [Caldimonas mangrovi]
MPSLRLLAAPLLALAALSVSLSATAQSKKELVQKLLQLQQPGIESIARTVAQRPAIALMQDAAQVLQTQVPADKRQEVAKTIEGDLKKYADDVVPTVQKRAVALAPVKLGPVLEEKFTEDELKQVIAWLESPVSKKYQQVVPELESTLAQALVDDTRSSVEPKLKQLQQTIRKRLGLPPLPAAPAGSAPVSLPKK